VERKIEIYETIEEFDQNLPETVTLIRTQYGSKVYLVGTAHFSLKSQDDVSFTIRNVQPDIVMVELCGSRVHMLKHDEKTLLEEAKSVNFAKIQSIMKANGTMHGLFYILLLKMSAEITSRLGMAPGGEFRRAMEEVQRLQAVKNCVLHLGDRPINITLQRALNGLSFFEKTKLVWSLLTFNESISEEEVEECKKSDILEKLLEEMAEKYPAFGQVFVRERDMYMTHSLTVAALPQPQPYNQPPRPVNVVGVVGIGHVAGILSYWDKLDPMKIPQILIIPPPSRTNRVVKFTVKYTVLGCLAYGAFRFARPHLQRLLKL
jgi:pheromone shutdown protein TraB